MSAKERFPHVKSSVTKSRPKSSRRPVIILLVTCLVLGGALALAALYAPFSPFVHKKPPTGPKLMVGTNNYTYACSVFNAARTASALGINSDATRESIQEEYAFDPANTNNKPVDLLALIGTNTATSTCRLKFDRVYVAGSDNKKAASFINVTASLVQFADARTAKEAFDNAKQAAAAAGQLKTLGSQKDSYYPQPIISKNTDSPTYIRPTVLYKNMLIRMSAPLAADDTDGTRMSGQLATVVEDAKHNIDANKGSTRTDFSGTTSIDGTPYVDVCTTLDYRKLASLIDQGIQLNPVSAQAIQSFAPDEVTVPGITQAASNCSFTFRTTADEQAQEKQKAPASTTQTEKAKQFNDRYPHYFNARIAAVKDSETATSFIATLIRQTEENSKHNNATSSTQVSSVDLGDSAIRIVTTPKTGVPKGASGVYDSQVYYVAEGSYVYQFATYFTRQSEPYQTTNYRLGDKEMKAIVPLFTNATKLVGKK